MIIRLLSLPANWSNYSFITTFVPIFLKIIHTTSVILLSAICGIYVMYLFRSVLRISNYVKITFEPVRLRIIVQLAIKWNAKAGMDHSLMALISR